MRLVIQRVKNASVETGGRLQASIGAGLLVLLGIEASDTEQDIAYLCPKVCNMRIFADHEGKMNLDIRQVGGEILVVSQFTLHASTRKGNRPSFSRAAPPATAVPLYEKFIAETGQLLGKPCSSGIFGADMQVSLLNDGPVTIFLDSKNKE